MRTLFLAAMTVLMLVGTLGCQVREPVERAERPDVNVAATISLPSPQAAGQRSVEAALAGRHSERDFTALPLTKEALGQLLWAMQGIAVDVISGATRTAPSAGATHPLEVYVVIGNVTGLESGIYNYVQHNHSLRLIQAGEFAPELMVAALEQEFIAEAPVNFVLAADFARTTVRYGERGRRYVYMEVGHATQNLLLQAEALGLGTVAVGAFHDNRVATLLDTTSAPLMIVTTGFAR